MILCKLAEMNIVNSYQEQKVLVLSNEWKDDQLIVSPIDFDIVILDV